SDSTTTIACNHINTPDRQTVEERREHSDLSVGRDTLTISHLRATQPKKIRSDATSVCRQALQRATPLKAVKRKTVKEQRGAASATFDVRNPAKACIRVSSRGMKSRCVQRPLDNRLSYQRFFTRPTGNKS